MSETIDIVEQLRNELDETMTASKIEAKLPRRSKASAKIKSKKKFNVESFFNGGNQQSSAKSRVIIEIDAEVADQFKRICREKCWTQKSILERFIQGFVEHHSS